MKRYTSALALACIVSGCQLSMPVDVQHVDLVAPGASPAPEEGQAIAPNIPTPSSSLSAASMPTTAPAAVPSPKETVSASRAIKVSGHVWGYNPGNVFGRVVTINDDTKSGSKGEFETLVKPSVDGKTYLYVSSLNLVRQDPYNNPFGEPYQRQLSAVGILESLTVEVPNDEPEAQVDVFMSYPIGQGMSNPKPGHLFLSMPGNFHETSKVLHVALLYKNGEGMYPEPTRGSERVSGLKWADATLDGRTSIDIGGLENDCWYAVKFDLTLPNGRATTGSSYFLSGRSASTGLKTNPAGYTRYDSRDLPAPAITIE